MFGGGGFFGSGADQSSNDSSQSTAGAQSQTGEAIAVNIKGGGKKSKVYSTVNVVNTDHGAIESAYKLGENAILGMFDTASKALSSNEKVAGFAIDNNTAIASEAIGRIADVNKNQTNLLSDVHRENIGLLDSITNDFLVTFDTISERASKERADALVTLEESSSKAMDFVFEASQSDAERVTETFLKWALGGVIAIVAIVILGGRIRV